MRRGSNGNDVLIGGSARDRLDGGRGHDRLTGGAQNDRLIGGAGRDVLSGGSGNDKLIGGTHNDRLGGGTGRDALDGGRGDDRLSGGLGRDVLDGGPGSDRLIGGGGADRMIGGAGHDTFVFSSPAQMSAGGARDTITDFVPGRDKIDFTALDADLSKPGINAFTLLLTDGVAFNAPGQLRYDGATGLLSGNTDADPEAEFEIVLANRPVGLVLGRDILPWAPDGKVAPLPPPVPGPLTSAYDRAVLLDRPTLFVPLSRAGLANSESDSANPTRAGTYHDVSATLMPNGDGAAVFDGQGSYFEFADSPDLSVAKTGVLTVEAWLRPDALIFPKQEGSGYVHWLGKGELSDGTHSAQMEWAARMYGANNTDIPWRENRISGYAFNLEGGRGIGSYFQDDLAAGGWIHFVLVINTTPDDAQDPGYTRIYRDGSNAPSSSPNPWDDMDSLLEFWPDPTSPHLVTPGDGDAPLRVGTRDFRSFFMGAVGKVAVYDYELTPDQIQSHYEAMWF